MLGRAGICLLVMTLVLFLLSCSKLSEKKSPEEGKIAVVKMADNSSIPKEWGKLVSVSVKPDSTHVFQLWFQDEDGNIHMTKYNTDLGKLLPNSFLIPQK